MLSLTLRPTFEAELPKAVRPARGHSPGQANAMGPVGELYRIAANLPHASSFGTNDLAIVDCKEWTRDPEART